MTPLPTSQALDALAHAVVSDGFDLHRDEVRDVVRSARRAGIRPVLAEVLADATAPRPVRERALGLLLVSIDAHERTPAQLTTGAAPAA